MSVRIHVLFALNLTTENLCLLLSLDNKESCTTCHILRSGANYSESFNDNNPHTFASNFASMSKPHCATCHSGNEVNQSCLTCRNYHVGEFVHDTIDKPVAIIISSNTKSIPQ